MAERVKDTNLKGVYPRSEPFGTAATSARQQVTSILSRESLLRLMLSFVLAVALWLYVTGKQDQPAVYDYPALLPVTYHGLNSNYIVNGEPVDVRVRFQLDHGSAYLPGASSFQPYVNLASLKPGLYSRVRVGVQTDPGITVTQVIPAHIPVRIEPLKEVTVPVGYSVEHRPKAGYGAIVSIQPSTIRVSGPASLVSQVQRAVVTLPEPKFNFSGPYTPDFVNGQGQPVRGHFAQNSPQPAQVQVTVKLQAPVSSKTVPVVVAPLEGRPRAGFGVVGLDVQPSQITAQGPTNQLTRLPFVSTEPLSINGHGGGTLVKLVRLRLPHGMTSTIRKVKVTAQLKPVDTSTTVSVGVSPDNVSPALMASIKPASIVVTVVGPSQRVRQVAEHLRASVNLYSYGIGTWNLPAQLTVTAPAHYQIKSVYPSLVTVTIAPR